MAVKSYHRIVWRMPVLHSSVCVCVCVYVWISGSQLFNLTHTLRANDICEIKPSLMCVCCRGEEEIAPGMKLWRKALTEVRSSSQLAMCLQQLQKSIAWERSIMKVVGDVINLTVRKCRNVCYAST